MPLEWEVYWLVLEVPAQDWSSVRVTRNGEEFPVQLRRREGKPLVFCEWPRSNAGRYRLRCEWPGGSVEREVRVEPRKLSSEDFSTMLEDLTERLPAEVTLSLQRAGGLIGLELTPPAEPTLAGELGRLRRALRGTPGRLGMLALLPLFARNPHRTLREETPWTRAFEARAPLPGQLHRALLRAENLDAQHGPLYVLDGRALEDVDTYENRLVRYFLDLLRARTARLLASLEASKRREASMEARELLAAQDRARREVAFLEQVAPLSLPPTRPTMVLQRVPAYRAAFEGLLAFLRGSCARLDAPFLAAPLENVPALYQLWGTLQVLLAVLECAPSLGLRVQRQRLVTPSASGAHVHVLRDGEPALELLGQDGTRLEVIPERSYGREGDLHSVSFEQRPDVALEVHRGGRAELLLFDPKYKLDSEHQEPSEGHPKKVDIDKMHAYRDAIRDAQQRPVVRFVATLYPGKERDFDEGLAALCARPGHAAALRARVAKELERVLLRKPRAEQTGPLPRSPLEE